MQVDPLVDIPHLLPPHTKSYWSAPTQRHRTDGVTGGKCDYHQRKPVLLHMRTRGDQHKAQEPLRLKEYAERGWGVG